MQDVAMSWTEWGKGVTSRFYIMLCQSVQYLSMSASPTYDKYMM